MSEDTKSAAAVGAAAVPAVAPVLVDVYAYREGEDVLFSHAWTEPGGARRRKGKIEISEMDTPIHFQLHDRTGLGLAFFNTAREAMWVDLADCPTGAGHGGQIRFPHPPSANQLQVTDANVGPPCTLHFALRFTGNPTTSGPPYEYDPEIKNV